MQDEAYVYEYDMAGEALYAETPEAVKRWAEQQPGLEEDYVRSYYDGSVFSDDFDYFSNYYNEGRRYGLDPRRANLIPEYTIDLQDGVIYFNSNLNQDNDTLVTLRYILNCDHQLQE